MTAAQRVMSCLTNGVAGMSSPNANPRLRSVRARMRSAVAAEQIPDLVGARPGRSGSDG